MGKKPFYINWLFWLSVAIVLPIIVYFIFKCNSPDEWTKAKWGAGDILGYVGSILGGAITLVGVVYTISQENKKYYDEKKTNVKPYLSFYNCELVNQCPEYKKSITLFKNVENSSYFYSKRFDPQKILFSNCERVSFQNGASLYTFDNKDVVLDVKIKNIGNGVAKALFFQYENVSSMRYDLSVGEEMYFSIFLGEQKPSEILVNMIYENLYDDIFEIKFRLCMEKDKYNVEIIR